MEVTKWHLSAVYTICSAMLAVGIYLNNELAHADDVDRTYTQIMTEVQSIGIKNQLMYNDVQSTRYADRINDGKTLNDHQKHEYDLLLRHKVLLMERQLEVEQLRREVK